MRFVKPNKKQAEKIIKERLDMPERKFIYSGNKTESYIEYESLKYEIYLPHLINIFKNHDERALEAISKIDSPKATNFLIDLLESEEKDVVKRAYRYLQIDRFPDPKIEEKLLGDSSEKEKNYYKRRLSFLRGRGVINLKSNY